MTILLLGDGAYRVRHSQWLYGYRGEAFDGYFPASKKTAPNGDLIGTVDAVVMVWAAACGLWVCALALENNAF